MSLYSQIKTASLAQIHSFSAPTQEQQEALALVLYGAQQFDKILQKLTPVGDVHDAYLAGGALRDCFVMPNPKIKDLDIFWQPPSSLWEYRHKKNVTWEHLLKPYFKNIKSVRQVPEEDGRSSFLQEYKSYFAHSIVDILKIHLDDVAFPIDLIITPGKAFPFIFKYFDFSICKIAMPLQALHTGAILPNSSTSPLLNLSQRAPLRYVNEQQLPEAPSEPPVAFSTYWDKLKVRYAQSRQPLELTALPFYFRNEYFSLLQEQKVIFEGFTYNAMQAGYSFNEHWKRIASKMPTITPFLPPDSEYRTLLQRSSQVYELAEKWVLEHALHTSASLSKGHSPRRL